MHATLRRPVGLLTIFVVLLVGVSLFGLPYYVLPAAEQARHPFHAWLSPAGYVGGSAGLLALTSLLALYLLPIRKQPGSPALVALIRRLLEIQVRLAFALPLLLAVHAAWRFDGVVGLAFWAALPVWVSGVVGWYAYAKIPRGKAGIELSPEQIGAERGRLLLQITSETGLEPAIIERTLAPDPTPAHRLGVIATLLRFVSDDLSRRRAVRRLDLLCQQRGLSLSRPARARAIELARREMALSQQGPTLGATRGLLRHWGTLHRPLAVAALLMVAAHLALSVGTPWLR